MAKNTNRDYLVVIDVKSSNIIEQDSMNFYINDNESYNIFVNLVVEDTRDPMGKYVPVDDASKYTVTMNIVKPTNEYERIEAELVNVEDALYLINLPNSCTEYIGAYKCEVETHYETRITTSNKFKYRVKASVLNDLDNVVEAPEYPIVLQMFERLSDINQYEEDRRTAELARQIAEQQRQETFNELKDAMQSETDEIREAIAGQNTRLDTVEGRLDNIGSEITDTMQPQINSLSTRIDNVETVNNTQNTRLDTAEGRLDVAENRLDNIGNDITNTMQPVLNDLSSRIGTVEAVNAEQNSRLDAIEVKNQQQDDRFANVEAVNKRQDIDIKCLYNLNSIDITEEGNSVYLQNSAEGKATINEIQGQTLVNCNKEADKELILNGNINTSGYGNVTLDAGVDGGLVDVALEGNTMVNVCAQKEPVAITKSYTVETGNHVALQGEYDGKCRPVVTGNTLWIDNDTEEVLTAFDDSKNLRLQSSFEDKVVTQEMVDAGEELAENLGKYKVDYVITTKENLINEADLVNIDSQGRRNIEYIDGKIKVTVLTSFSFIGTLISTLALKAGTYTLAMTNIEGDNIYSTFDLLNNGTNIATLATNNANKHKATFTLDSDATLQVKNTTLGSTLGSISFNLTLNEGEAISEGPSKKFTKTFYLNSPLLEGDTIEQQGDNVVHVHRSELRAYETDDELTLPTDMANTLVTKSPTYEVISTNDTILCDSYVNGHLDVDSAVPIDKVDFLHFEKDLTYLYANTQYTVQFTSDKAVTVDITLGGTQLLAQSIVVGLNRIAITTPSTLVDNKLIIDGVGANINEVVVTQATDQDFGYFEGMKSVGECEDNKIELLSYTKNLLDINTIFDTPKNTGQSIVTITNNTITFTPSNGEYAVRQFYKVSVKPNTQYTISGIVNYGMVTIYKQTIDVINFPWNDKHIYAYKNYTASTDNRLNLKFTTGSMETCVYVRFSNESISNTSTFVNMQLEEGASITTYISHAHNTQTLTHEPLRAVGDVKDKYVLIDGKWYIERNTAEVVFDGSFGWEYTHNNNTDCTALSYTFPDGRKDDINVISDKLKYISYGYGKNTECVSTYADSSNPFGIYISISNSKLSSSDQGGILAYLQANPTKVIYQLATPTYEPIDYNPFTVYSDITHISNNSTIPCNMTIKNTGFNCLLKPSTTYTVSSNLGLNTVTTPSTLTEDCLRFYDTDTSDITTMNNVMVLEGDYTTGKPIPSHFSGIESAFEQEYDEEKGKYKVKAKIVGKNLLGNIINNSAINTNGVIDLTQNAQRTDYCRVNCNTQYIISGIPSFMNRNGLIEFDKNKKFIKFSTLPSNSTFTTTCNTQYIIYYYYNGGAGQKPIPTNIQLEYGTEATSYEPYKESVIEFYIDKPLRGIGDVKDKVYVKDNKVVVERKCGSVVLDGSDSAVYTINTNNTTSFTSSFIIKLSNDNTFKAENVKMVCDVIANKPNGGYLISDTPMIRTWTSASATFAGAIYGKYTTNSDIKTYFTNNPTTVVYQLQTPTYEEVDFNNSELSLPIFNSSTIFFDNNVPVTSTIKYTYSTPLTAAVLTMGDVSDQQDALIIDLATQVAVLEMTT